jgi:hypothetical protein
MEHLNSEIKVVIVVGIVVAIILVVNIIRTARHSCIDYMETDDIGDMYCGYCGKDLTR